MRIFRAKKPIVAAVHGAAIGGGLGLAVSADLLVACPETRVAANFTRLGFHPGFGLTVTLPALIRKNDAELMFYTSRRIGGEEALQIGLANVLVAQAGVRHAAIKLAEDPCTMRAGLADRVMATSRGAFQGPVALLFVVVASS